MSHKFSIGIIGCCLFFSSLYAQTWKVQWPNQTKVNPELTVSANGHYLTYSDGTPFFYMGDTAWELFHKLNREEADHYLEDRAAKGFTVIQSVVLSQLDGLTKPNAYGALPLKVRDPARPNEDYFKHVDYIVDKAASLGLFIGMLPTWGSYWKVDNDNQNLIFNPENARKYGEFLGNRYNSKPIIWILGGDNNIDNDQERAIITAMAEGLRKGDGGVHLITYHPRGPGRSSAYFDQDDVLDFNMYQSSHAAKGFDNGLFAAQDYQLKPAKPTIDGEPRYENIMVGFYYQGNKQYDRFTDFDVRNAAYWSLLAGACGHTYGNNNIWQMWDYGQPNIIGANIPWYQALDHPGSFDMMYLRKLFESRPFQKLHPAQEMIVDAPVQGPHKVRAALADDGSFAFIYASQGDPFTIKMDVFSSIYLIERWFDPRYGISYPIHQGNTTGIQTFTPPTNGIGYDWILVIDVANKQYPEPGLMSKQ